MKSATILSEARAFGRLSPGFMSPEGASLGQYEEADPEITFGPAPKHKTNQQIYSSDTILTGPIRPDG